MMTPKKLFDEYRLNHLFTLKNKILMAPMTRAKANDDLTPTIEMAQYYARRSDAGLIITEGTVISPEGLGYWNVPGIFNDSHIKGWRQVTDAVHQKNGLIFMQLWHVGRVSHPNFLNGSLPISASETTMKGRISRADGLFYGKSRAATANEIKDIIKDFAQAAKNAILAGFDGIEIHGANGYLIDQFLHYATNERTDAYGHSAEKMARFALDIVKACGEMIGYERVGLRLSPGAYLNEIVGDKRDAEVFKYLLEKLNSLPIAYIHTGNFDDSQKFSELNDLTMTAFIRSYYKGTVIACGGYSKEKAEKSIAQGEADLIAIGRPFIANPDLIQRLTQDEVLKNYDVSMLAALN